MPGWPLKMRDTPARACRYPPSRTCRDKLAFMSVLCTANTSCLEPTPARTGNGWELPAARPASPIACPMRLNLHGPSMTLDTDVLFFIGLPFDTACQDLKLGGEPVWQIAGGVNVSVHPNKYLVLSTGQSISSDGHCQSFGKGGDGYIPGEGVGVVILKRLSESGERRRPHLRDHPRQRAQPWRQDQWLLSPEPTGTKQCDQPGPGRIQNRCAAHQLH